MRTEQEWKDWFSKYAKDNKLSCGPHFIVLKDGSILKFNLGADSYESVWLIKEEKRRDLKYESLLLEALNNTTTILEKA